MPPVSGRESGIRPTSTYRAYAQALLRCGTSKELAERPGLRLRLTLGPRKELGHWKIAHEHHSFPHD